MPRCFVKLSVSHLLGVAAFVGLLCYTRAVGAQGPGVWIRPGIGVGYTATLPYAGESPGGDWNGEAFVLVGFGSVPFALRPTLFTYGRGTDAPTGYITCPRIVLEQYGNCPLVYTDGSGRERATGGTLDAVLRLSSGLLAPYVVGGVGPVFVSRKMTPEGQSESGSGAAYEFGAGGRLMLGSIMVFAELKFFETEATAKWFHGHSVHMVPFTVGLSV